MSKFPQVFPVPDQKSLRLGKLLVEDIVPLFGVPEALLWEEPVESPNGSMFPA